MLRPQSDDVKKSLEQATALYESQVEPVLGYLAARGLDRSTVAAFRLGLVGTSSESIHPGHEWMEGRLAIPSLGPNGVQAIRFRCLAEHDHDDDQTDCQKYRGLSGVPTRLFNTRAISTARDVIAITEGELDAIVLNQVGVPAVAVTGATNWKAHHSRVFTGFPQVVVVGDNDGSGRKFAEKVQRAVLSARVAIMKGEEKEDVSSFYVKHGADALREALGLKEAA